MRGNWYDIHFIILFRVHVQFSCIYVKICICVYAWLYMYICIDMFVDDNTDVCAGDSRKIESLQNSLFPTLILSLSHTNFLVCSPPPPPFPSHRAFLPPSFHPFLPLLFSVTQFLSDFLCFLSTCQSFLIPLFFSVTRTLSQMLDFMPPWH